MSQDVVGFEEIDGSATALVGGKGANLGELSRLGGVLVPPGVCVTTTAYRRVVEASGEVGSLVARLAEVPAGDADAIGAQSAAVRAAIEAITMPHDLAAAIGQAVDRLGDGDLGGIEAGGGEHGATFAVRSSATAEDLPTASFAGQQDTFLGVTADAVVEHVVRCWASLFTDRAVAYRNERGIDHGSVHMAVVIQRMVDADASGVMFTADPLTSDRATVSIEAVAGLGEALVSGLVTPDTFQVRDGAVSRQSATATLDDRQVLALAELGRLIEAHFGAPQDIEWCLADDVVQVVQSRPITTLFPIPLNPAPGPHVYVSVGHQQMMTDPMPPLGLSMWKRVAKPPMFEAAGRLFVDVAPALAVPALRANVVGALGKMDPRIGAALDAVASRPGFLPEPPPGAVPSAPPSTAPDAEGNKPIAAGPPPALDGPTDPGLVTELIAQTRASVAASLAAVDGPTGEALLDAIDADITTHKVELFDPRSNAAIMAGMEATWWRADHLDEWLGDRGAADVLTQSVPHNVTAEMGLALLDVADVIRRHPAAVALLEGGIGPDVLERLAEVNGGPESRQAIDDFLDDYGMRCVGEIDITRPRWAERPDTLVPLILGNVHGFEPGAGPARFEQGRHEALAKRDEVLARLRDLPDGERLATEADAMIDRARTYNGYREFPKYGMISRYFGYKQALVAEADRLVATGVLADRTDLFLLTFEELRDAIRSGAPVDQALLAERAAALESYRTLTPPRVITSDGAVPTPDVEWDHVPPGALGGIAVSSGTVEGRARVVHDLADARIEPGDILVTRFTDPSWSPLFVSIAGLVTEVGGQMTHGAVIAREYGIPAVVGVDDATTRIRDMQRIRVHGGDGYVELLE